MSFASFENIGKMQVDEVLLRPQFVLQEGREGGFEWGESLFGISWSLEEDLHARIKVGPLALRGRPQYYEDVHKEDWGFIEAYGEWLSPYGEFRMGLLPVGYGVEGSVGEAELYFPRSLWFRESVVSLRDLGFQYYIMHRGFFTSLTVHNGEAGEAQDSRTWYTAKWGWQDREKFWIGFSGQAGTTQAEVTSTSGSVLGAVDVTKDAKWRMGSFFVKWYPSDFKMIFEFNVGEVEQEHKLQEKFGGGHFDVMWKFSPYWTVLGRYDHLDPNTNQDGDLQREWSLGFGLSNLTETSTLFLIGTKVLEEDLRTPNDEIRLIWRLTPSSPSEG